MCLNGRVSMASEARRRLRRPADGLHPDPSSPPAGGGAVVAYQACTSACARLPSHLRIAPGPPRPRGAQGNPSCQPSG